MAEGRLIKYLFHSSSSLENYDELPDHFKIAGPMRLRFNLSLVTSYAAKAHIDEDDDVATPQFGLLEQNLLDSCVTGVDDLKMANMSHQRGLRVLEDRTRKLTWWLITVAFILFLIDLSTYY
jgi:hypothetical protein